MVQGGGELDAPVAQACPGEVGVSGAVGFPDPGQCCCGVGFVGGVGDAAVCDASDGGFARVLGGAVRPPGHDGCVGQEQGRDEGFAFLGEFPVAAQHDDFGGSGVSADPDLGVQSGRCVGAGVGEDDDAAGVFAAGVVGCLDGFFFQAGGGDHYQGQDPSEGDHAFFFFRPRHNHPDLLGRIDGGEGQGNPRRRWLGGVLDPHHGAVLHADPRLFREERGNVRIRTDT